MKLTASDLLEFAEERLDAMLARPGMWGSAEAVEMQVLLLLELEAVASTSREVNDTLCWMKVLYRQFIHARVPSATPAPLAQQIGNDLERLARLLGEFRDEVQKELRGGMQAPGQSHDEISLVPLAPESLGQDAEFADKRTHRMPFPEAPCM